MQSLGVAYTKATNHSILSLSESESRDLKYSPEKFQLHQASNPGHPTCYPSVLPLNQGDHLKELVQWEEKKIIRKQK